MIFKNLIFLLRDATLLASHFEKLNCQTLVFNFTKMTTRDENREFKKKIKYLFSLLFLSNREIFAKISRYQKKKGKKKEKTRMYRCTLGTRVVIW